MHVTFTHVQFTLVTDHHVHRSEHVHKCKVICIDDYLKVLVILQEMAQGPLYHDPWARREAWRNHPIFSKASALRNIFPGFGIAVVAFTAYVVYDNINAKTKVKETEAEKHH